MATTQDQGVDVVNYTNGATAVSSGDVIVLGAANGVSVGVALTDIAASATGAVAIRGTFNLTKLTGADITIGETVDWDVSAASGAGSVDDNAMTAASGDVSDFGIAMETAGTGVTTIAVQLLPGNGTIT